MSEQELKGYEFQIARMAEMLEASLARERALALEVESMNVKIEHLYMLIKKLREIN